MSTRPQGLSARQGRLLVLIVVVAAALRLWCFIGYVRGDDPLYVMISKQLLDNRLGFFTPQAFAYGVNYRLGLYVPVAASFAVLGVNDFSYVLVPILASLGSIVLVARIGAALFDAEVALIAALLMALSPFDTAFASTMVIDLLASFLTALAFYAVIVGGRAEGRRQVGAYALAAGTIWIAYWVKEPAMLLVPVFLAIIGLQLVQGVSPRGALAFCASLALCALLSIVFDLLLTGAPLNRLDVQLAQSGVATGPIRETLLTYPRWLLFGTHDEGMPCGYFIYLLPPALVYALGWDLRRSAVLLIWLLLLAFLLQFMPMRLDPLVMSPRYHRYLNALVAPAALVVAAMLSAVQRRSRLVVGAMLLAIAVPSIREARGEHGLWLDGTADARQASRALWELPAGRVFSDGWFCDRYRLDGGLDPVRLQDRYCTDLLDGQKLSDIVRNGEFEKLRALPPGYVVAGGSRVHYAAMSSVLQLEDHMVPGNWRLVREIANPPAPYRLQPLRIWKIVGDEASDEHAGTR